MTDYRASEPAAGAPGISAALRAAWARRLRHDFDFFNFYYARKRLRPPLLMIDDDAGRLGAWDRAARCITISAVHILAHSWSAVCATLRHEMAHQYADEVLGCCAGRPHDAAFAEACRVLRIAPEARADRATLEPLEASAAPEDAVLARVKKLLALAGSPNEHEAASAMRMANRLMLEYNLDQVGLDRQRGYASRILGRVSGRVQEHEKTLAGILQDHFFVQVIWVRGYEARTDRGGNVLEVLGTPENLQMAEYVYHYVRNLMEPLWRAHRRAHPAGDGTRMQYFAGLLRGFQAKLDEQRDGLKQERGLVWVGDPRLTEYFREMHPRVEHRWSCGVRRTERYAAGVGDGRAIRLRRGIAAAAAERGRLLGPGA